MPPARGSFKVGLHLRASALVDVASRYREAFIRAWQGRHAAAGKRYTAAEAEFLPASLALIERPVSPTARITGAFLVLLVFSALLWASIGHVDIMVAAQGRVIPSSRTKVIASVQVASVRAIHVVEGQEVRAGDVLVELDASVFEADELKAKSDRDTASLAMARSLALVTAIDSNRAPVLKESLGISAEELETEKSHLQGQYLDFRSKLARIDGEIHRYSRAAALAQERARSYEQLAKTRDVPMQAYSEKLQAAIDLEGELLQAQNSRASLIAEARRAALDTLTEAKRTMMSATQDAARARAHAKLMTLRSPIDGSVQQLMTHTVGGVVPEAQPLMLIVPNEDAVEVDAYVENKDVGFVRRGQRVEVKVDAFDYTQYGVVQGEVISVSKDAVEDDQHGLAYRAKIRLNQAFIPIEGQHSTLTAGMTVTAEIRTGTRRVIQYLLSPLARHRSESLKER